jgi:hypothetical protein
MSRTAPTFAHAFVVVLAILAAASPSHGQDGAGDAA